MASYSSFFSYVVAEYQNNLPDATSFVNQAYNLAWPQILAFCTAILGIVGIKLILNAFTKG